MTSRPPSSLLLALLLTLTTVAVAGAQEAPPAGPLEYLDNPYLAVPAATRATTPAARVARGPFVSVQVNVDGAGANIVGDAANEPSIAVDPNDPLRVAVGWRQFDSIASNFRQAGVGWTADGGLTWNAGVINPGVFRSDPVLGADAAGIFYYLSLKNTLLCDLYTSSDGGATWSAPVAAFGGDKEWMSVASGGGLDVAKVYQVWSPSAGCCGNNIFTRSLDGGQSFEVPVSVPGSPQWGTTAVGPEGDLVVSGFAFPGVTVARSSSAGSSGSPAAFEQSIAVDLGGGSAVFSPGSPNPGGLLGQVWTAVDPTDGDNVYLLASVDPPGPDPLDVHLVRSTDGGATWSAPVRLNDDPPGTNAWQWFGTLSVAPDGRLDVFFNDSRDDPGGFDSVLTYTYSVDGGLTWSDNLPVSPPFDPHLGWPNQDKIGDYYHAVSDLQGVHLAYAATFNGEQDVYYLRLLRRDVAEIFVDGFESGDASAWSQAVP